MSGEASASVDRASSASVGSGQTFFRYSEPSGRVVIVDSLDKLPPAARDKAERFELDEGPGQLARLGELATGPIDAQSHLSWPPVLVGLTAACVCLVAAWLLKRAGGLLVAKLLGGVALVALVGALYLGFVRRSTGHSDGLLSSPQDIVDDARRTIDEAKANRQRQQEMLDQIERESR